MKNRHFLMILKDPKLAIFEPAKLTKNPVFRYLKNRDFLGFFHHESMDIMFVLCKHQKSHA